MDTHTNETLSQNTEAVKTAGFIHRHKKGFTITGVIVLMLLSFLIGTKSAGQVNLESIGLNVVNQEPPADLQTVDYSLLWKTLKIINTKYVDNPEIDQKELMYGAVAGLVRALNDPYSVFLTPAENEEFNQELNGNFEGIGAEIAVKNEKLVVVAPLPDSPAERAGLRAQDVIVKIDDEEVINPNINESVSKIRGPKGTVVVLTVLRDSAAGPVEVSITRDAIHVESVSSEIKNVNGEKILVVEVNRFGPDTASLFAQHVNRASSQGINGLVVDLRNNPGGYLEAAIDLASFWLNSDQAVLKELDADKNEFIYYARGSKQLDGVPTVILINEGSASASEIVTGALQDHGLATVVGMKSFGKGSVQDLVEMGNGAAVKITIAKWLTPNGRSIHNEGLEPDVEVDFTKEDFDADRDPQLDKALEIAASK